MTWQTRQRPDQASPDYRRAGAVTPDDTIARRLIANATRHLETAVAGQAVDDLAGATSSHTTPCTSPPQRCSPSKDYGRPVAEGTSPSRKPSGARFGASVHAFESGSGASVAAAGCTLAPCG
jgi:hypothetical protein